MRKRLISTAAVLFSLTGFVSEATAKDLSDPWLEGESRGYLMALCRMEEAGLITPKQSYAFLLEYRKYSGDFNAEYLEAVLRNYIGLKKCSFSKRVVIEKKPLIPHTNIRR